MDYFTLITGIAGLIGFVIQLFDVFPRFAQVRQSVVLLLAGLFLGSLLRAVDTSSIKLNLELTLGTTAAGLAAVVLLASLVAAGGSRESARRAEFFTVAGFAAMALLAILFAVGLATNVPDGIENAKRQLTISELLQLSQSAEARADYDRAVMHLESVQQRLAREDERVKVVRERIKQIRLKELH